MSDDVASAVRAGDLARAADLLVAEAAQHEAVGRAVDAATGYRLAAGLATVTGRFGEARGMARRSVEACDHPRSRFAALLASAEVERMAGDPPAVLASLDDAVALAPTVVDGPDGSPRPVASPLELGAVLRRRAAVLHALGRDADAVADLHRASDVLATGGQGASAAAADLELAGLLAEVDPAGRDAAVAAAQERAGEAGAGSLLAQVAVAEGLTALGRGDAPTARERFAEGIEGALASVDAATYIAATAGLAEAAEADGDRLAAYRALASGWVTVADLLGREVGAEAFRPLLQAARARWGAAAFADVKAEHDRERVPGPRPS